MTEEIIKFLGGTALVLAAAAWLVRSLVAHFLSKDVELFKQQLQARSTVELERLRHDLRLVAAEHEKRVHLLQERRAQTIADLYAKLIDFLGAAESFASLAEWSGEQSKEEKAKILAERAGEFRGYFLRKRIYFSEEICHKVEALFQEVHGSSLRFRVWLAQAEKGASVTQQMHEAWDEAWKVMKDRVPPLVAAVDAEFRALLGVGPKGGMGSE